MEIENDSFVEEDIVLNEDEVQRQGRKRVVKIKDAETDKPKVL